jgi:ribose transport system substrate-binding protein
MDNGMIDRSTLLARGAAAAAAVGAASLPAKAFAGRSAASKGRIAFGQPNTGADVAKPLLDGAKRAAKARGYELLESSANGQLEKQLAEINTWIAGDVDAMTILPLDPKAMVPLVKKAHGAGIKWVSYAARIPGADGFVFFDDFRGGVQIGTEAARWINTKLGGEAEVALLAPTFVEALRQRIGGAEQALRRLAPKAKVVARTKGLLAADGLDDMRSILSAHPDVKVVLCAADDGCLGVSQAYHAAGKAADDVFVAGWDGSRAAMQKILDGDVIRASGALDLIGLGRASVDVAANLLERRKPTKFVSRYILVTKSRKAAAEKLIRAYG